MSDIASTRGIAEFRLFVRSVRQRDPKMKLVSEAGMNSLGYSFLNEKKYPEASAIVQMNTEDFPKSANPYDSLAEALAKSGDVAQSPLRQEIPG